MIASIKRRLKLFSSPRKEFYLFLKDLMGFYPENTRLYDVAFTHKSASIADSIGNPMNNERLEYLGDAILGAVVAEYLYNRFPQRGEGFLTQMRSRLVNRSFLTKLTIDLGLEHFIRSKTLKASSSSHIYGDVFEALIGAIYLDKGYETTKYFIIKKVIREFVDVNEVESEDTNYKSQLIEWGQKNKIDVEFVTEHDEETHIRQNTFITSVIIKEEEKGKGFGSSKKESQQNAAQMALEKIEEA